MIQIGLVVSEIWPVKVKSRGARSFKQACLFSEIWHYSANKGYFYLGHLVKPMNQFTNLRQLMNSFYD